MKSAARQDEGRDLCFDFRVLVCGCGKSFAAIRIFMEKLNQINIRFPWRYNLVSIA